MLVTALTPQRLIAYGIANSDDDDDHDHHRCRNNSGSSYGYRNGRRNYY